MLSAREREVVALVAEGRSNDEIAAELVLSVRTVERHLQNAYTQARRARPLGPGGRGGRAGTYVVRPPTRPEEWVVAPMRRGARGP